MTMKEHTFTILERPLTQKSSLIEQFRDEALNKLKEEKVSHEINRKATEIHHKIFKNFIHNLQFQLSEIDARIEIKTHDYCDKHYKKISAYIAFGKNAKYELRLEPLSEDGYYYTTYKDYVLKLYNKRYASCSYDNVSTIDDVIRKMKGDIVDEIKASYDINKYL